MAYPSECETSDCVLESACGEQLRRSLPHLRSSLSSSPSVIRSLSFPFSVKSEIFQHSPMAPLISLSIYSKHLMGGIRDPNSMSKKLALLTRLGLVNSSDRVATLSDIESVIVAFRIINFTDADLQICRDMRISQILEYSNPCNERIALKCAISVFETLGLDSAVLISELESRFRPIQNSANRLADCRADFFPSLPLVSESLRVAAGVHGHTLVAKRDIPRGESVISLDEKQAISVLSCLRDPRFPGRDLCEQGLHPDIVFLLYLIHLRDMSHSDPSAWGIPDLWRDFFLSQPSSYATLYELPIDTVRSIGDAELLEQIIKQNKDLETITTSLSPSPSFADLLWAKSLCTSRAFSLPLTPQDDVEKSIINEYYPSKSLTTLLPVVHFFNHDFRAQCETPVVDGHKIVVHSLVSISAHDEVFIIYGGMNNREFMLNYGFFIPNNPYDTIFKSDGSIIRRGALQPTHTEHCTSSCLVQGYLDDQQSFIASAS